MKTLLILLVLLLVPVGLYPTGIHPAVPYSLSDLVRQEYMDEVWRVYALRAYHGSGYRTKVVDGRVWFLRAGAWCRYELPAGWLWLE